MPAPKTPEHDSAPSTRTADQSVAALHNRLFFRLFQAGNALARQTVNEVGLSTVQWAVLGALSRAHVSRDGMTFSELVDYLGVSRQSVDGVLRRLERDHHVERTVDAADRRARRVILTAPGRAYWDGLQSRIYAFYAQATEGLRFDDEVALVHFLNRLNDGITQVRLDTPTPD